MSKDTEFLNFAPGQLPAGYTDVRLVRVDEASSHYAGEEVLALVSSDEVVSLIDEKEEVDDYNGSINRKQVMTRQAVARVTYLALARPVDEVVGTERRLRRQAEHDRDEAVEARDSVRVEIEDRETGWGIERTSLESQITDLRATVEGVTDRKRHEMELKQLARNDARRLRRVALAVKTAIGTRAWDEILAGVDDVEDLVLDEDEEMPF